MRLVIFVISLALWPSLAHADVASLAYSVYAWYAALTTAQVVAIATVVISVASSVYGSKQAKKLGRKAGSGAEDRFATLVTEESPELYVYGRARVPARVVAMLTSGDRDEFKHLVCIFASHECDAFEEIYIEGKALGTLNGSGYPTSGDYTKTSTETTTVYVAGTVGVKSLGYTPAAGTIKCLVYETDQDQRQVQRELISPDEFTWNGGDSFITVIADQSPQEIMVTFNVASAEAGVRVLKKLGVPGQTVEATTSSELGSLWPSTATLQGYTYAIIRLNLNWPEFQGGLVSIEALLRGKKLYDPRTDTTAWSQNNALVIRDYLIGKVCQVNPDDIPLSDCITAANVCDEAVTGPPSLDRRYTFNGLVNSDRDPNEILEAMAESMAGSIDATTWSMTAGKYVAPVLTLNQSDIVGPITITPAFSDASINNGVKGKFIGLEAAYRETEFRPYQDSVYRAADGIDLYANKDFEFTDSIQRVHNLCAIYLEDLRNGFTIAGEFSHKAWAIKVGQRVAVNLPFFGVPADKVFRVIEKTYGYQSQVELTIKEDDASIWDTAPAVVVDATPNTNLDNPFYVAPITGLAGATGTGTLLRRGDGTFSARIFMTWAPAVTSRVYNGGSIEMQWQRVDDEAWNSTTLPGDSVNGFCDDLVDGHFYTIRIRGVNPYQNVRGDWATYQMKAIGKSEPPENVTNFTATLINNGVRLAWDRCLAIDYSKTILHLESVWDDDTVPIFTGAVDEYFNVDTPPGTYTVLAKHEDTSGNRSVTAASLTVTVTAYVPPAAGVSTYMIEIYSQSATQPACPTGGSYTFVGDVFVPPGAASLSLALLLRMEGSDGGVVFSDSSSYNHTVTRIGGAVLRTAAAKYGSTGLDNAPSGSGLSLAYHSSLNLIGTDLTISGWARHTASSGYGTIIDFRGTGAYTVSWGAFVNYADRSIHIYDGPSATTIIYSGLNAVPATGIFYHFEITVSAGVLRIFINGAIVASGTYSPPATHPTGVRIGINQADADRWVGALDEIEVHRVALHTAAFTPPTGPYGSTEVYGDDPYVGNVTLRMRMPGAADSTTFSDESASANTVTGVGNVKVSLLHSTRSAYFDGSGDYLSINHSSVNLGGGDYCAEAFVYVENITERRAIFGGYNGVQASGRWIVFLDLDGKLYYAEQTANGVNTYQTAAIDSFPLQVVTHVAASKQGTLMRLFVNGTIIGTATSISSTAFSNQLLIGAWEPTFAPNAWYMLGHIGQVRITKGHARYTSNFVLTPSTPLSWSRDQPISSSIPTWKTQVLVTTQTPSVAIPIGSSPNADWKCPPVLHAQNGSEGVGGFSSQRVLIYKRATSTPTLPSADVTFTFATGVATGLNNGWTIDVPSGTDPLYVSAATAASTGATDIIAPGEWAGTTILVPGGTGGTNGINSATIFIFQRTATSTPPALPTATVDYTFATGVATGLNNSWELALPSSGGPYRWISQATALSSGATDSVPSSEWASARLLAQDGDPGPGADTYEITFSPTMLAPISRANGVIPSYTGIATTATLKRNGTTETGSWTVGVVSSSYAAVSISGATITLLDMSVNVDAVVLSVSFTRAGYATQIRDLLVSKVKSLTNDGPNTLSKLNPTGSGYVHGTDKFGFLFAADGKVGAVEKLGAAAWNTVFPHLDDWYLPTTTGIGSAYSLKIIEEYHYGSTDIVLDGLNYGDVTAIGTGFRFGWKSVASSGTRSASIGIRCFIVDGIGVTIDIGVAAISLTFT